MKHLIKRYLDSAISRRSFLSGLGALGVSSAAAGLLARSLAAFQGPAGEGRGEEMTSYLREVRGNGGEILVAQLKAAGVEYVFFNPSSGEAPFFDALVDEPGIHLIKGLQEGALAAMADGYARASGKTPFVFISHPGLPNAMTQVFNAFKDQSPMVMSVGYTSIDSLGQDGFEDTDHLPDMPAPITKWHWTVENTERIPEITSRAFKFASTPPYGPVFLAYPENLLDEQARALVIDERKFTTPLKMRPDAAAVEKAARLLLEAKNPLLYVGDDITWCGAQKEAVELAELLGLPVSRPRNQTSWSKPFPTRHPLYLGDHYPQMRYPGVPDVMLNLGSRMPFPGSRLRINPTTKLIQIRLDATNLVRMYPTEVPMVADLKLALLDLLAALRGMATDSRLQQMREARNAKTKEYTAKLRGFREKIVRQGWNQSTISEERLGLEMEEVLDKETCLVTEIGSGSPIDQLVSFGDNRLFFTNAVGKALGWGMGASFGVKLGQPDRPVVVALGDGAFLFSGPQPLWTMARYQAPVTVIVLNNSSYSDERNRMFLRGGRQFQTGRDMACYLGDPDVDFVKVSSGFGVEAESVREPSQIRAALGRAQRANAQGSPYLLDVRVERAGLGAVAEWHPPFSIKNLRKREV